MRDNIDSFGWELKENPPRMFGNRCSGCGHFCPDGICVNCGIEPAIPKIENIIKVDGVEHKVIQREEEC